MKTENLQLKRDKEELEELKKRIETLESEINSKTYKNLREELSNLPKEFLIFKNDRVIIWRDEDNETYFLTKKDGKVDKSSDKYEDFCDKYEDQLTDHYYEFVDYYDKI